MKLQTLPSECQAVFKVAKLGQIKQIKLIRQRDNHSVYRLESDAGNFVLKYFYNAIPPKELQVYALLQKNKVPTLPCYGMTDNCILLEDLLSSSTWRLATPQDMEHWNTGEEVAHWYSLIHKVGYKLLSHAESKPDFIKPWVTSVSLNALKIIESGLGSEGNTGWNLALSNCEALKAKYLSFPQTFNYNDFSAENLALSRATHDKPKAIVYDYDQFSSGTIYSDWRNITYSLKGKAQDAFMMCFGRVDEDERRLDEVLSVLHGLMVASTRKLFPLWAYPLRESIFNGDLERKIHLALEII